jgi:MFS family permease
MLANTVGANTVLAYTFGVFIIAFNTTYGWSRAEIALSMTGFTAVAFLGSSLIGRVADTSDTRRLVLLSMLAFGVGLLLMPLVVSSVKLLWVAYIGLAILGLGTSPVVVNRPLVSMFSRNRGKAIALALTGTGIGGFILPQVATAFVERGGWQYGFMGLGLIVVTAAPIVWLATGGRTTAPQVMAGAPDAVDPGVRLSEVCRSREFLLMSIIALFGGLGMSGPAAHLIPLLGDHGLAPQAAARLAAIIGVASVGGRLLTGVVLDRFDTPKVGAPLIGAGTVGLVMLARYDASTAVFAIALLGFVVGAEIAVLAYYGSRYFGLRAHATIFGWTYGIVALGSALAPVGLGSLRDHSGDYSLGFALSGAALAIASFTCLLLGPYRYMTNMRIK